MFLLNHNIQTNSKKLGKKVVVYRGVKCKVLKNAKIGQTFKFENFQSTVKNPLVSANFIADSNDDCTFYSIEVPSGCPNIWKIKYSVFEYEEEYLISPYTAYKLVDNHFIPDELYKSEIGRKLIENKKCEFYKLRLKNKKPERNENEAYWGGFQV